MVYSKRCDSEILKILIDCLTVQSIFYAYSVRE